MSTDDLTRRARETAARSHHTRPALADLLSELADEVNRLRALWGETLAERDAARAALERVTELRNLWTRFPDSQCTTGDTAHDLTRALEGKPS